MTRSTGGFADVVPGTEIRWDFLDSGVPGPAPNGDAFNADFAVGACDFSDYSPLIAMTHGNIIVKNDDF